MFPSSTKQSSSHVAALLTDSRKSISSRESISQIYDPSNEREESLIPTSYLKPTLRTSSSSVTCRGTEGSSTRPSIYLHHNPDHVDLRERVKEKVVEGFACGLIINRNVEDHQPFRPRPFHDLFASAYLLLMIWAATERMDVANLDCLRIVERCADILIHVREKIERLYAGQGDTELSVPIAQLGHSLASISEMMGKRASFDDDTALNDIRKCDELLGRVVTLLEMPAVPPILSTNLPHRRSRVLEAFIPPSHAEEDGKDISTQDVSSAHLTPVGIYATQRPRMETTPAPRQRNIMMSSHASSSNFHRSSPVAASATESPTEAAKLVIKTEKTYRLLAGHQHDFHESLTLFLWDPTPVEVGAVGFLSKPAGQFVTLFNAITPEKCHEIKIRSLSSLRNNGNVAIGVDKSDSRRLSRKAYDFISGSRTLSKILATLSPRVGPKRHTLRLKAGKKTAYMHAEITEHHYFEDLQCSKEWFKDNIDHILSACASNAEVTRETLMLVTGTLRTPNYGLFVSHSHPDGRAKFKVHPQSSHGQPWGVFTTAKGAGKCGPRYPDTAGDVPFDSHSKVSCIGDPWSTVLIARLQFRPGASEPTLL
ncbi:hypothetical protein BJ165DRAFT_1494598 [Panaeolus papilionaceus]|nr:hypothetical protein BJ165DRAFT_1494598 [Panaeolus papilionaceus]